MGAADTFRAAAIDQLQVWADRVDVPMIKQEMGSDPASVAFDALQSGVNQDADVIIIDTAGRLHDLLRRRHHAHGSRLAAKGPSLRKAQ